MSRVALIAGCLTMFASMAQAEDWPRWRGPRGDGSWQGPTLPQRWPEGGPRQVWRTTIGGGYAGLSVADGRLFAHDRLTQPREVERVLCFDAASGKPLWTHEYPVAYGELSYGNGPRAAPTVLEGRVYALGALGHLHCLNVTSGEVLWRQDLVRDFKARVPEWGLSGSPVIFEDLVIVHAGGKDDACVLAFDRRSGERRWGSLSDEAGYATPVVIERDGEPELVVWTPSHVRGIGPRDGKPRWEIPYKVTYGVSIATPIVREGIVFVSGYWEGSKAIQLGENLADAELLWEENRFLRGLMSQPLYRDGRVFLLEKEFGLTCFDLQTGEKLWDDGHKLTPKGRNPQATLVWTGDEDRVLALNSEGELILARLTPEGYQEQDRAKIIGPTWVHPAYAGELAFARNDEELVCVRLVEPGDATDDTTDNAER